LHNFTESTRDLVKDTSNDIKDLNLIETNDEDKTRQRKIEQQKLSKDFQKVLTDFQKAQRLSAEKQREYVDRAKASNVRNDIYGDSDGEEERPLFADNSRRLQLQVVDNELEYNEALISEREDEIRDIEQGIRELNEIFKDLGTLVNEQQSSIDNIESNVTSIVTNVHSAAEQLGKASRYQKSARNRMCCLLLIFVVIGLIVSLGVLAR
jgi:syntaxin 7